MQWLSPTFLTIQVVSSITIIVLVLLQQGKGADMGATFGGGSAGSLFGATGAANFLSRATKWAAIVFFSSTAALAYIAHHPGSSILEGGIMQGFKQAPAPAAPAPVATGSAVPSAPASSTPSAPAKVVPAAPSAAGTVVPGSAAPAAAGNSTPAVPSASGTTMPAVPVVPNAAGQSKPVAPVGGSTQSK
ncbi:preprotein translocase subunit SecG [Paralcaligenes ureilyticus]|uniref:Protein-export membrane protein SecG n=1 Tax=Paralcaligenes ureilyticus TaxID=627131 RepID=A0A4R3LTM6_9BURK|nr:preprotein translocase subunit SecG [Paralcaligenes ureilyticus]TCT03791.1 protein translocase subunit secG [Paralcaligenes ureilyticus]